MKLGQIKDNTKRKKGIINVIGRQGVYAVAFVCLAVVGIVLAVTVGDTQHEAALPTGTVAPQLTPNTTQPDKGVSGDGNVVEPVTMIMPVQGEMLKQHALDKLVFNQTLQEWSTHCGIDISCNEGERVLAVLSGTVESVNNDLMQGNTVVIDHGNGLKTFYASLESVDDSVTAGAKLNAGDVIGVAGKTAMNEISDGVHLHFEVWKDGIQTDPMEYLADNNK